MIDIANVADTVTIREPRAGEILSAVDAVDGVVGTIPLLLTDWSPVYPSPATMNRTRMTGPTKRV